MNRLKFTRCDYGHFYSEKDYDACPICRKLNRRAENEGAFGELNTFNSRQKLHELAGVPALPERKKGASVRVEELTYSEEYPKVDIEFFLRDGQEATLGRSKDADYILNDRDHNLSRVHCCITCDSDVLFLKNRGINFTYRGGKRFENDRYYSIMSGDIVRMGSCMYRITYTGTDEFI